MKNTENNNNNNHSNDLFRDYLISVGSTAGSAIAPTAIHNSILKNKILNKKVNNFKKKYELPVYDYDYKTGSIKSNPKSLYKSFTKGYVKKPANWNKYTTEQRNSYINNSEYITRNLGKLEDLETASKKYRDKQKYILNRRFRKKSPFNQLKKDVINTTNDIKNLLQLKRPLSKNLKSYARLSLPIAVAYLGDSYLKKKYGNNYFL